jgi:hypothetical protein
MWFLYKHYQDKKVFYVGIGKIRNKNGIQKYYRAYEENKRNSAWHEVAKGGFTFEIVEESDDKKHILEREKYWIAHYGRRITGGQLVNVHPGGHIVQEDPIKKQKRLLGNNYKLGKLATVVTKMRISYGMKGNGNARGYRSPEAKINISRGRLGNKAKLGKYGNRNGDLINIETGMVFNNIHDINDFFFDGSIKSLLTLKTYIKDGLTYKGLTFYRNKKDAI